MLDVQVRLASRLDKEFVSTIATRDDQSPGSLFGVVDLIDRDLGQTEFSRRYYDVIRVR